MLDGYDRHPTVVTCSGDGSWVAVSDIQSWPEGSRLWADYHANAGSATNGIFQAKLAGETLDRVTNLNNGGPLIFGKDSGGDLIVE